jgi:hypothetical protein
VVVIATPPGVPEATTRALINRAKQRGCVLIPTTRWPQCDLTTEVTDRHWVGLRAGHGRLRRQDFTLRASGRGRAAQPTTVTTPLPPSIVGHRIADMSEMVIRPQAHAPAAPTPPTRPRPDVQHKAQPADPWAELQHRLPPIERKRRY